MFYQNVAVAMLGIITNESLFSWWGCSRSIIGFTGKDRDWIVVDATPATLLSLGYQQVGKDFPVFLNPKQKKNMRLPEQNVNLAQVTLALFVISPQQLH